MSDAVAKLRFDLLANAAGLTGPLAEAGSASEKMAQRFERAFDSTKQAAARAEKEVAAWKKTVAEMRDAVPGGVAGMSRDQAWNWSALGNAETNLSTSRNRGARLADLVPFGKTARAEISKEAAETAALLGKEMSGLEKLMGRFGLDDLVGLGTNLLANPFTVVGGAALAGEHELSVKSDEMRDKARAAIHAGQVMGTSTEDASRLTAVGFDEQAGAKFQRSIADNSSAFKDLGLDATKLAAKPLSEALVDVSEALTKGVSPAQRVAAEMELFGMSGAVLEPVLTGLKRKLDEVSESAVITAEKALKTKNYDTEKKEKERVWDEGMDKTARAFGADESFGSSWEHLKGTIGTMLFGGFDDMVEYERRRVAAMDRNAKAAQQEQFRPAAEAAARQEEIRRKQEEERQKRQAEAEQAMADLATRSESRLIAARSRDDAGNQHEDIIAGVRKQGNILGWSESDMHREIERQEQMQREGALANKAWSLAGSRTASEKYQEDQAAIDAWNRSASPFQADRDTNRRRMEKTRDQSYAAALGVQNPEQEFADKLAELSKARGKFSADKLQRAAASAADALMGALDEPFMTSMEKYEAHMKAIQQNETRGAYDHDQADRRRRAETDQELSHAGIKRPLDDFKKSMEEIAGLRRTGAITPEEYAKRERELRQQAVSGQLEGIQEIHGAAAVSAGSREAYSAEVQAKLNDPRIALAVATNKKLDELVKAAQEAAKKAAPIVAEAAGQF